MKYNWSVHIYRANVNFYVENFLYSDSSSIDVKDNTYFGKFIVSLLSLFSTDKQLLEDRGAFIVR